MGTKIAALKDYKNYPILLIDDSTTFMRGAVGFLKRSGLKELMPATDGVDGIKLAQQIQPALVLLDVEMPNGLSGFDVLERFHFEGIKTKVILITAHDTGLVGLRGAKLGITDFVPKSEFFDVIEVKIKQAIEFGNYIGDVNSTPRDIIETNLRIIESQFSNYKDVLEAISLVRTEIEQEKIDKNNLQEKVSSLRQVVIGASGGVAATGIIEVISGLASLF